MANHSIVTLLAGFIAANYNERRDIRLPTPAVGNHQRALPWRELRSLWLLGTFFATSPAHAPPLIPVRSPEPTLTTLASSNAGAGRFNSLALPAGDRPVVSDYDDENDDLRLAVCNDASCTNPTLRTVDGGLNRGGSHTSVALNSEGHPVIAYLDISGAVLKVAVCPDANCTTPTSTTVDNRVLAGNYTSLAPNSADLPLVCYTDYGYWTTIIAFCTDLTCANPGIVTVDGAVGTDVGDYTSLALSETGYPVLVYRDRSNQRPKAVFFDYLPAPDDRHLLRMGADMTIDWGGGGGLYDVWCAPFPHVLARAR